MQPVLDISINLFFFTICQNSLSASPLGTTTCSKGMLDDVAVRVGISQDKTLLLQQVLSEPV